MFKTRFLLLQEKERRTGRNVEGVRRNAQTGGEIGGPAARKVRCEGGTRFIATPKVLSVGKGRRHRRIWLGDVKGGKKRKQT